MSTEVALEFAVEQKLREAKLDFKKHVVVGDARPDFVVTTANGDHIVVEVKAWESNSANTARAINQVERYKELTKAAAAIIVTAAGQVLSIKSGAVVPIAQLVSTLSSLAVAAMGQKRSQTALTSRAAPKKSVFASMPFASQYDDTFLVAIEPAALASGAIAERVDHNGTAGNIVAQIQSMIRASKVVVADLSDSRPNVLHEVGFAEALQKPVIQICSSSTSDMPFNVRNNQTIKYSIGQAAKLRKRLETELQKVI